MRKLLPLNGLRAFEAAGRHLSFTKAAEELNVTPAAVSQQIKGLEEYVGVPLFKRMTRSLLLTEHGQRVLPLVTEGFDKLGEAHEVLRTHEDDNVLTVTVPPTFGVKWLVSRLDRFRARYPAFDVRIDANDELVDLKRSDIDAGIRYGRGEYPDLSADRLFDEVVVPVCHPRLTKGERALRSPQDLASQQLIHVDWEMRGAVSPSWSMWLRAAGVEGVDPNRGPRFNAEAMAIAAALEGQGVALVSLAIAADDIDQGRLVRAFPERDHQLSLFGYHFVYPPSHLRRQKVNAFREWVLEEASITAERLNI